MLLRGELIGKEIVVVDSKNKAIIGIEGRIVDETKNLIEIMNNNGCLKRLIKNQVTVLFKKEKMCVDGKLLFGRAEDRLKRR